MSWCRLPGRRVSWYQSFLKGARRYADARGPRDAIADYVMVAVMRPGARGTGERIRRSTVPGSLMEPPKKKSVSASAAWREARALLWAHRRRLATGLALMLVSRLAGLVLPASSKYLIDDVLGRGRAELAPAHCTGRRGGHARAGGHVVCALSDPGRSRSACDHRHAQARPGARDAPARSLLRLDADRRAGLENHVRCRRHQESRRHGTGAARGRPGDRGDGARRAVLAELASDGDHDPRARGIWRRHGVRLPHAASRSSASAARSTPK